VKVNVLKSNKGDTVIFITYKSSKNSKVPSMLNIFPFVSIP